MYDEDMIIYYLFVVMHERMPSEMSMKQNVTKFCHEMAYNSNIDGMPTTEEEASLLVATLRGASDRPWCEIMVRGFGLRLLIVSEGNLVMYPVERPVICRVEVEDPIENPSEIQSTDQVRAMVRMT